jgi:hypothetical protein
MKNLDMNWARTQLENAKIPADAGNSIVQLLELWSKLEHRDEVDSKVVDLFSKICQSIAVVDTPTNEIWEDARPGFLKVGDEVRVKSDAFDDELGRLHNGRRGRIVGVRYGDIIIKTTDGKEPTLDGSHYSPYKLEKLVAVV